jgi:hypothetical protein
VTWFVIIALLRLSAAGACIVAARRYAFGDRLNAAWILFAVNLVLLFAKDLLLGPHAAGLGIHLTSPNARAALVASGNLATVIAMLLLGGAWRAAGFGELASLGRRVAAQLFSIALALATTGFAFVMNWRALGHGVPGAVEHLASDVGDFLTFSLIAPLLLVALALRGGRLFWPWLFIVLSKVAWMLFDVLLTMHSASARPWVEAARGLALALMLLAAIAQCYPGRRSMISARMALHPLDH